MACALFTYFNVELAACIPEHATEFHMNSQTSASIPRGYGLDTRASPIVGIKISLWGCNTAKLQTLEPLERWGMGEAPPVATRTGLGTQRKKHF